MGGGFAGHAINPGDWRAGSPRGVGTQDRGRDCVLPWVVLVDHHQLLDVMSLLGNLETLAGINDFSLLTHFNFRQLNIGQKVLKIA